MAMIEQSKQANSSIHVVGVDRDLAMLQKATMRLSDISSQIMFVKGSYAHFPKIMEAT
jgi:16S rRNA C1402 N4-methylase RsmH